MSTNDLNQNSDVLVAIDRIARRERGRLISLLLRHFGPRHIQLAEDVAQDALLTAMSTWPYQGIPDNPVSWLARVARNRAIDRLRRESRELAYSNDADERVIEDTILFPAAGDMSDHELSTIFLCCHPQLNQLDQLALTLRVVGGFTAREIASVLIVEENTLAQRLSRAKRRLRTTANIFLTKPSATDIEDRLDTALKVIYLMFSLGYAPAVGEKLVRHDVAQEALRLSEELTAHTLTNGPTSQALAALLNFQTSRLGARENKSGEPILFQDQDRSLWDRALITKALKYLSAAASGSSVTRYHLEAGIAAMYATAATWVDIDWPEVMRHYRLLREMTNSPVVVINACVAQALSGEPEAALRELLAIAASARLKEYAPFHIAHAEILCLLQRHEEARVSYSAAISCRISLPVQHHLEQRLASTLKPET